MKRTYLTLLIMMLVVGFAAVTTNLVINGKLNIASNIDEFEEGVVFTRTNTMHGDATISEDGKSITFKTTVLKDLKEESVLEYDIINKSLEYDAEIVMNCKIQESDKEYEEYIELKNSIDTNKFTLTSGATKTGRLTITLIKTYVKEDKSITFKCNINANAVERNSKGEYIPKEVEYEEILLNGATPVLENSPIEAVSLEAETSNKQLIPVIIDEENGTVTRADTTKEWYDYETKKWANAVILANGVDEPEIEEEISDDDIESYFVWIPKFKYKIFDMGHYSSLLNEDVLYQEGSHPIEIEFGTDNTTDNETECVAPNQSGEDGTCSVGKWMTHPAFTSFGNIKGFWVGKFETGYNQNDDINNLSLNENWTTDGAQKNEQDSSKIIIKPNVYSWRNITTKNAFETSYNYQRNLDSHMMKNTEWGAVAYLSHSKYGICNGNVCEEIRINNSSNYLTGVAAKEKPTLGHNAYKDTGEVIPEKDASANGDFKGAFNYNNKESTIASTTNNYTGIYDMSGGAWEKVAGYMRGQIESSGLIEDNSKYYDVYNFFEDDQNYNNRILGDATGELGPFTTEIHGDFTNRISFWYKDYGEFIKKDQPWFIRGGFCKDGIVAGLFAYHRPSRDPREFDSFRIVLSPQ